MATPLIRKILLALLGVPRFVSSRTRAVQHEPDPLARPKISEVWAEYSDQISGPGPGPAQFFKINCGL